MSPAIDPSPSAGGSRLRRLAARVGGFGYPQRSGRRARTVVAVAAAGTLALALASCGGDDDSGSGSTTLTVLAASSLTNAFDQLEGTYEDQHSDVDVKLSYDSSSILAEQVTSGAPADVLATADPITMKTVTDAGDTDGQPTIFARNTMVIVTPSDNPAGLQNMSDLTDASVAVCVPEAPCGNATQQLLKLNNIDLTPATEEDNVSSVLTKVTSGEVDAGFVYVTDAQAAGSDVQTIQIPHSAEVINDYPIAVIAGSDHSQAAQDWVDLVMSQQGQDVLAKFGFQTVS